MARNRILKSHPLEKRSVLTKLEKAVIRYNKINNWKDTGNFNVSYDRIKIASKSDIKKLLVERVVKLTEEVGELAAEVLIENGYSNKYRKPGLVEKNIRTEAVDCLIMVLDILNFVGATKEDINKLVNKKVNKWEKGIAKKKLKNRKNR